MVLTVCIATLPFMLRRYLRPESPEEIIKRRNFFGVIRILEDIKERPESRCRTLIHGSAIHGMQFQSDARRRVATTYYGRRSGVGLAIQHFPRRRDGQCLHIGIIGLGVGTIAAYGRQGDRIIFYEIDPQVVKAAERQFTFLRDARSRGAEMQIILGDARIVLEQQLAQQGPREFDLLVVDAFSGDAVPIHLLTAECFRLYWKHLNRKGILALHISNRHVDLSPVIRGHAIAAGRDAAYVVHRARDGALGVLDSEWILVTGNQEFTSQSEIAAARHPWPQGAHKPLLWTDDFASLVQVMR
jgi:hypothetical protein